MTQQPSTPAKPAADTTAQRRVDPAAETEDPSGATGDSSRLTPDHDTLEHEKPIEDAIEKSFPGKKPG